MPKLDLLGLRTHTSLKKAGELVSKKLGQKVDPLSLPHPTIKQLTALYARAPRSASSNWRVPGSRHSKGASEPGGLGILRLEWRSLDRVP